MTKPSGAVARPSGVVTEPSGAPGTHFRPDARASDAVANGSEAASEGIAAVSEGAYAVPEAVGASAMGVAPRRERRVADSCAMDRLYDYVGPEDIRALARSQPHGTPIDSREALRAWLARNPEGVTEGATFVVTRDSRLHLAPRRSEHVACAAGQRVRSAGEIAFEADASAVAWCSNQSSGYCPEPESFAALRWSLVACGVELPEGFTHECIWRRCARCSERNLVKDGDDACACCGATLPPAWNFATDPPLAPELLTLRDALGLSFGPAGFGTTSRECAAWQRADARVTEWRTEIEWLVLNASPAGRCYAAVLLSAVDGESSRAAWGALLDDGAWVTVQATGGCSRVLVRVGALATAALGVAFAELPRALERRAGELERDPESRRALESLGRRKSRRR